MPKDIDKEKAILNFLKSPDEIEPEVIRQGLKDFGYDPDEVAAKGKEFIQGLLSEARAGLQESSSPLPENAERLADEMESQDFDIPEDLDQAIADILAGKMGEGTRQQPRAYWRNFDKATREDKIQILKDIRLLKALLGEAGAGQNPAGETVSGAEQARKVLAELSVAHPGEASIRDLARARGALVREGTIQGAEGWLVKMGGRGVIRVREGIPETTRKRYVIAHELGHFELHSEADQLDLCLNEELVSDYKSDNQDEIAAHRFAHELLLPEKLLKGHLKKGFPDFERIRELAEEFDTSIMLTTMRLIDLTKASVALVVSRDGNIRWFKRSYSFIPFFQVGSPLPPASLAQALHNGDIPRSYKRELPSTAWVAENEAPDDPTIVEECFEIPAHATVMSLLRFG